MTEKLTNNQQTVLNLLEVSKEPLKAYTILFDIQKKRNKVTSTSLPSFR